MHVVVRSLGNVCITVIQFYLNAHILSMPRSWVRLWRLRCRHSAYTSSRIKNDTRIIWARPAPAGRRGKKVYIMWKYDGSQTHPNISKRYSTISCWYVVRQSWNNAITMPTLDFVSTANRNSKWLNQSSDTALISQYNSLPPRLMMIVNEWITNRCVNYVGNYPVMLVMDSLSYPKQTRLASEIVHYGFTLACDLDLTTKQFC